MGYYSLHRNDYLNFNGKIVGNARTNLVLPDATQRIYYYTDPLFIYELWDDNNEEFTYSLRGVIDRDGMTADEVIETINELGE